MVDMTNIVTLSDDIQYVVVSKAEYEGKIYYYFVDIRDNKNIKFLYEDGDELVEVDIDDDELMKNLMPLFVEKIKEMVTPELFEKVKASIPPELLAEISKKYQE